MNRLISLILFAALLLTLCGCAQKEVPSTTLEPLTEESTSLPEETTEEEKEETKTKEKPVRVYETASDPLTREKVEALPVANSSMSVDELRQLCVDYVCLSVSFQWIPNMDFAYRVDRQEASATFYEGQLYGGIPYVNTASGNLYRILEYYNSETGILDLTPFKQNKLLWGTACSGTTGWGWARVINSARCAWTADLNVKNGLVRVGNYTYDDNISRYGEGNNPDCSDIAKANGEDLIYEAYSMAKMADCLVNNGHVRMVKEVHVEYGEDGKIDPKKSYIIQCEQGLYTTSTAHDRISSDGTKYKIQGNDNLKSTFSQLYKSGYLPHTFKEFLGLDPVEKASATIGIDSKEASLRDLQKCTLKANYVISDVFTVIRDKDGNELIRYTKRMPNHFDKNISLLEALPGNAIQKHQAEGTNVIEISCQLGNGEVLVAYSGTLIESQPISES